MTGNSLLGFCVSFEREEQKKRVPQEDYGKCFMECTNDV
jgi:hypothetical protein